MKKDPIEIIDEVVIAGGPYKRHRSRAGLQCLPDGELIVTYRIGWDMFNFSHGAIVGTWSQDGGHIWEEPMALIAEPGWAWLGAQRILQMSDGQLIMLLQKSNFDTGRFTIFPTFSSDHGRTWERIGSAIHVFKNWNEPSGQGITQGLPDNNIMIAFQGADIKDAPSEVSVAVSVDNGASWNKISVIASNSKLNFREADLLRLRDGRLIATIRTDDPPYETYQTYSADEGNSWTPIKKTGFKGHCPCIFQLETAIICIYRDMEPGKPGISYSLSSDNGQSWSYGGQLYKSPSTYNGWASACGYPSIARLPNGKLYCIFHTSAINNDSEIRGLKLIDNT